MKFFQITFSSMFLILLLSGCSSPAPDPTPTQLPTTTETPVPTPTVTDTPQPSSTPTPRPTPTPTEDPFFSLMPVGEPAIEWQGIPIMPEAVAGEGNTSSYRFAIEASIFEITAFYDRTMAGLGWESFATGSNDAGVVVMLMYAKDLEITTISLISGPDGLIIVMFV